MFSLVVTSTSKFSIVYLSLEALPFIYLHLLSAQWLTQFFKALLEFVTMSMASYYTKESSISSSVLIMMLNKTCPCRSSIAGVATNSSEKWPPRLP